MTNVLMIGCVPSEILSACHITITSLAKGGHKIYAIIAPTDEPESSLFLSETAKVSQLAAIGIIQTFIINRFDYSAITQVNADAVKSYVKNVRPSLIIMPSWKSHNNPRKVLARSSLIACRGIGTILMYELDNEGTNFNPNIIFQAYVERSLIIQQSTSSNITDTSTERITTTTGTTDQDEIEDVETITNESSLEYKDSKTNNCERLEEKFESHRTLLLEEEGLF